MFFPQFQVTYCPGSRANGLLGSMSPQIASTPAGPKTNPTNSPFPVPCSLFPVPCSLFPIPCSLFPVPCFMPLPFRPNLYRPANGTRSSRPAPDASHPTPHTRRLTPALPRTTLAYFLARVKSPQSASAPPQRKRLSRPRGDCGEEPDANGRPAPTRGFVSKANSKLLGSQCVCLLSYIIYILVVIFLMIPVLGADVEIRSPELL